MRHLLLVTLCFLAAGCASGIKQTRMLASASNGDPYDPKYSPYHFGNLMDRFTDQMNAVMEQQKLAGAVLDEAGNRCIKDWAQFAADYPALEAKLGAETQAALAVVEKMKGNLVWHYASATPSYLDESCGPDVEKYLHSNLLVLNQLVVDLEISEQNFERIQLEGRGRFGDEAGANYSRKFSCPVKYRYDEVVSSAFSAISNRQDLPISGFAGARLALKQFKLKAVSEISGVQAMLESMKTDCK